MRPTETNHWNLWGTLGKICPWQNLQTDRLTVICDRRKDVGIAEGR